MPDIFPTLLDLAGFKSDIPNSVEGISHASYFLKRAGKLPQEQFIMGRVSSDSARINSGFRGVRTQRFKLAYVRNSKKLEGYLFDLKADPYEMNNLYSNSHPEVSRLKSRLKKWLVKTKDGFVLDEQ